MRLIDADALTEFIENKYDITRERDYEGGRKDACVEILEEINRLASEYSEREIERLKGELNKVKHEILMNDLLGTWIAGGLQNSIPVEIDGRQKWLNI